MVHRWFSLVLFPYVWALCAAPDRWPGLFLKPLSAVLSVSIPDHLNVNLESLILAGIAFGQFIVYALVLYWRSHKGLARTAWTLGLIHLSLVVVAATLCQTRGWPSNSDEGQHARQGGELYPNK